MNEVKVLIMGIGGPTSRAIARSLKKYSTIESYNIIGADQNPLCLGLYERQYIDKSYLVPSATNPDYWETVNNIIAAEDIEVAIVQAEIEVEIWAHKYEQEKKLPCPTLLPPYSLVKVLRNKAQMTSMLADTDFVPKTCFLDPSTAVDYAQINKIGYPCWIRGAIGSSGMGALKLDSDDYLRPWININPDIDLFLISEYLPGRNLACKCLYNNGILVNCGCAERIEYIMAKVAPSGITGNTSYGRLINCPEAVDVSTKCIDHICKELNVKPHGVLTVDLKEDVNGRPLITEINVRNVAFTSSFAAAGINFAENMVLLSLGKEELIPTKGEFVFEDNLIFIRDVDGEPILMKEDQLLGP